MNWQGGGDSRLVGAGRYGDVWPLARLGRVCDQVSCREELAEDVAGLLADQRLPGQRRVHGARCVDVLEVCPAVEVLRRVDGAVVVEVQQPTRMDLEVE